MCQTQHDMKGHECSPESCTECAVCAVSKAFSIYLEYSLPERSRPLCHNLSSYDLRQMVRRLRALCLQVEEVLPISSLPTELQNCFKHISHCLEQVLEENYVRSLARIIQPEKELDQANLLRKFACLIRDPPDDFSLEYAIRCDVEETFSQLSTILEIWKDLIDEHLHVSNEVDPTEEYTESEAVVLGNSVSIHVSTGKLHSILHQHWPCRVANHSHHGTLGECSKAHLQLEPHWITQGITEESFFLMLKGSTISQECRVHLTPTSDSAAAKEDVCMMVHKECKGLCLHLELDGSDQLWAFTSKMMGLQLQVHEKVRGTVVFALVPLETLLQQLRPTFTAKTFLELTLARSLLLLMGGPWVESRLRLQNVSVFCRIEDGVAHPQFDKIFLSTWFGPAEEPKVGESSNMTAIFALGILLAEIELGDDLQEIYEDMESELKLSDHVRLGHILAKECGKRIAKHSGAMRSIDFCLGLGSYQKISRESPNSLIQEDQGFVEDYYSNVVTPLEEELLQKLNWSWDEVSGRAPRSLGDNQVVKFITSPTDFARKKPKRFPLTPPPDIREETTAVHSDRWFDNLKSVHLGLYRDRRENYAKRHLSKLIKVAVLDTGVDLTHEDFGDFIKAGQLHMGYNFVDPDQPMTDLDGHGTHCCNLIFKTAPFAQVYPLKVFKSARREDISPELVGKAIRYAIEELEVDIISMSFVFTKEEKAISDALSEARTRINIGTRKSKPVLMFAAASNHWALNVETIGYPARVGDKVICVNSSTANDEKSSFSPHGVKGAANLSAVGENVRVACPKSNGGPWKRMSGTSFSTPIVAGVAALLLDFATQEMKEVEGIDEWSKKRGQLWETTGMRSVLRICMTANHADGKYNLVKPWQLLSKGNLRIACAILEALESRHTVG